MENEDELERIGRRGAEMFRERKYNGSARAERRVRFDGTITMGNTLTIIIGLIAAFGMYISFHDDQIDMRGRVKAVETTTAELVVTQKKTAQNQNYILRLIDKLGGKTTLPPGIDE